jgi:hypothetical protein
VPAQGGHQVSAPTTRVYLVSRKARRLAGLSAYFLDLRRLAGITGSEAGNASRLEENRAGGE